MEWKPLAPRARLLFYLQAMSRFFFFWLPLGLVGGVWASAELGVLQAAGGVGTVLFAVFVLGLWMPSLSFDRWSYSLREDDLLIAHGILVRSVVAIPTSRIQHIDVRQGPLEQSLGLSRVLIYTASGMGADGVIPGLATATAESLRDDLVAVGGDSGV